MATQKREGEIMSVVASDPAMITELELIEKFILETPPSVSEENLDKKYDEFLNSEKHSAFKQFKKEDVNPDVL